MMAKFIKSDNLRKVTVLVLAVSLFFFILPFSAYADGGSDIISSFSELKTAIHAASDGDILYVGDIDFTPAGNIANFLMRIEADKNLTIKSGKASGKAVFTNGSFILSGSKGSSEKSTFRFENIIFDGGITNTELKIADFDYPWSEEEQRYLLDEPVMAQYALSFRGNVDASFADCDFKNYMHEYGPIAQIRYGDYTTVPSLLEMFGDYSACSLNLSFEGCNISGNAAAYDGGAIFIEGNDNVSLTAANCIFKDNYSGEGDFRIGGGAVYASGATLTLDGCRFENNSANYLFPDMELPDEDTHRGGALFILDSRLTLTNSIIAGNSASMGGGISLTNTDGTIDGCVFCHNRAEEHSTNWMGDVGPWNNMAQGGAIYHTGNTGTKVTLINSSIYGNSAQNAYGGIYSVYSGVFIDVFAGQFDMKLCSYIGNTCDSTYDYNDSELLLWCSHPGDFLEIPYITATGCIIIDDGFEKDFPRYEEASEGNSYNYIASPQKAGADGLDYSEPESCEQLKIEIPDKTDIVIPAEYGDKVLEGRYDGALKKLHIGSNYETSLYVDESIADEAAGFNKIAVMAIAGAAVLVGLIIAVVVFYRRRKTYGEAAGEETTGKDVSGKLISDEETTGKDGIENPDSNEETTKSETAEKSETIIVKAWFTKEEIDTLVTSLPKARTLTSRESEVFVEILEGKKQKEIAYDLGIEITTVKDYYRKIYDRLGFANKEELLRKCSEFISK